MVWLGRAAAAAAAAAAGSSSSEAEETGETESLFWQYRFKEGAQAGKILGPLTSVMMDKWMAAGRVKKEGVVEVRQTTAEGEPIDGMWREVMSVDFKKRQMMTDAVQEAEEEEEDLMSDLKKGTAKLTDDIVLNKLQQERTGGAPRTTM
mmetsp:Transcript_38856/g.76387  ORF Transcript_38856/g.76387 Transcript_38856/m.76387 type:complete len:149 (-) Transcript_38856:360-806(-)